MTTRSRAGTSHRPRTLLSGLLFCGCCGGVYRRRAHDRYVCTNHALGNGCDNSRTRHLSADTHRRDMAETEKAIREIVRIIEQGGWHRALSERLTELEAKQDDLIPTVKNIDRWYPQSQLARRRPVPPKP